MVRRHFRSGTWGQKSLKCFVAVTCRLLRLTNKWKWDRFGTLSNACYYSKNVLARSLPRSSSEWGTSTPHPASKSGSSTLSVKVRRISARRSTAPNLLGLFLIDLWNGDRLSHFTSWETVHKRRTSRRNTLDVCWCTVVLTVCVTTSGDGIIRKNASTLLTLST